MNSEGDTKHSKEKKFIQAFWKARKELIRQREFGEEISTAYEAALTLSENNKWEWATTILKALKLYFEDEDDKSLTYLNERESVIPSRWKGFFEYVRACALNALGNADAAIISCRIAISTSNFDHPGEAWFVLGSALNKKGDFRGAISAYQEVLKDPNFYRFGALWNNLANVLSANGQTSEAIEAYHKAISDPSLQSPARAWNNLAITYMKENPELAREALSKALSSPDPKGNQHSRSKFLLQIIESSISTSALSPDDRALIEPEAINTDEIEYKLIAAIKEAGDTQYEKYIGKIDSERKDIFSILRGWSSAVTLLEGSERRWRGGGYFVKWRDCGIVIDPGFDFLRNFHDAKYHGREINAVIVSHNHPDHNSDLKYIDDLKYELWTRLSPKDPKRRPYVLIWDRDTDGAVKFTIEKPEHRCEPVPLTSALQRSIDLSTEQSEKLPFRVLPFKVDHAVKGDVPNAMGLVLELLNEAGKAVVRIGYTSDTAYFPELHRNLENCDILIAHVSQPSIEELQSTSKLKEAHLGYQGTVRLLRESMPKLTLIGEFWAGFTDLRIPLVKGIRQRSGLETVLPAGLGMHIKLPSLNIECTECSKDIPYSSVKITPSADQFGDLSYLCPSCMIG